MRNNRLLTIQDVSCLGQCSLTVALPIISALGVETCIIPSAVLSTHTSGFENYSFRDLTEDIPQIFHHWNSININFDVIYTGYIANAKQFETLKNIFDSSTACKIVDPVLGDKGIRYKGFDDNFVDEMRELCSKADVIVPNLTEVCLLLGEDYHSGQLEKFEIENYLKRLSKLGAKNIVLTGVGFSQTEIGAVIYCSETEKTTYVLGEKIEDDFHGTGDIFASVVAGSIAKGNDLQKSVERAVEFVAECIRNTVNNPFRHKYGVNFEEKLHLLTSCVQK